MENIRTHPLPAVENAAWRHALPQAIAILTILAGLAAYLVAPFLAQSWMEAPFIGAFVEQNMVISYAGSSGSLPALAPGRGEVYRLQAVNGHVMENAAALRAGLQHLSPGDPATLTVRVSGGSVLEIPVTLRSFSASDRLAFFYFPYLTGILFLGTAVWVFSIRRRHASGRAFAQFAASAALVTGLLFDHLTTHALNGLWIIGLGLAGGSAVNLALLFPREEGFMVRRPSLGFLAPLAGVLLALYPLLRMRDTRDAEAYLLGLNGLYAFAGLALAFLLAWPLMRPILIRLRLSHHLDAGRRPAWPYEREQARRAAITAAVSFGPLVVWLAAYLLVGYPPFSPILLLFMAVFPVMTGYTMQRYRMLQADLVLSMGVRYGLLSVMVAVGYALAAAGLGLGMGALVSPANPLVAGFLFFVLALAISPLRDRAQWLVDQLFFRNKRAYQDRLQAFSSELTSQVDLPDITGVLRRNVAEALTPSQLYIYIYDPLSDQYTAAPDEDGKPATDLRFHTGSGLAARLSQQRAPLMLNAQDSLPPALETDRARLALLGAQVFVPLPGRRRLSGWLALGPRLTGEPYTSMQMGFAEALCDQAALAIERAQVVANMEHRVREMNVLTRVAQGVNITLSLDDILELVFAQTTQIIPAAFFRIMLYNRALDTYQYAFYLEQDERLTGRENLPIPAGQALEQEIVRQRRAIRTEDYNQACQQRGILSPHETMRAYMGVALNAGAETIGALSLGSSDPAVEYTPEQQALLQAIADQVAGALVKARLLEETQVRARQLASLNEVTRQLTSTLETEPLLQGILQSAVDILNCEAGSLLLVDRAAGELVFRSVVGPVAATLLNTRMPATRGIVGKSVQTAEPIIVNDVSHFPEWFAKPDQDTGFSTRAVLVIPLLVKDVVIGVLEVINKQDSTIFSREDQELLSAFASQAAVAIENARLYTNTDQALAARVEELSVMQRIDRELNTSLDTSRAMRITLDWAMRQSGAKAGLVGVLQAADPATVRVMASEGYAAELEPFQEGGLPVAEYQLQEAVQSGLSQRRQLSGETGPRALLAGAQSQAIVPIRRETTTIGLLLLESVTSEPLSDEVMNFLIRLGDHASIAISNAQLYAAVQQANLAKSDFVSFVAHELKNPMTSVKGYTELISAGAVGPITEGQSSFLGTIRANIDRMNTLVSDLNDMSKIEVGRLRLEFKSLRLEDSIQSVVRSTHRQIEEKQQALSLNIPAGLPQVWADRTRLEQVLVNLFSNALKYTPPGGAIEVAAERCPNQWDAGGAREVVHVWVRDDGIGISEEDQKKIFQKFFRSEDPRTREVIGTGLGLNITRSLVEMQGGRIWFESTLRQGTTFHFTVPVSET